ncbi:class I SAM-dependent methyltransferase [Neorhizobium sp. NCHU2750]|uniref:class I SAM-dependent methyltransferase n=1 Tax=Neorhizobium sp. NCHU2750 TaxID=1825976 RepID=UPI000E7081CA
MTQASRHDDWRAGEGYERFIGRWSRRVAPRFLDWLEPGSDLDWLEVGCGTGALTEAIVAHAEPRSVIAIDPSENFLQKARLDIPDPRAEFRPGNAQALSMMADTRDIAVSGLVLNFVPDPKLALQEMQRVTRPKGMVGFYVWDYPGGGMGVLQAFWSAATALDPTAAELDEKTRFPFCTGDGLLELATAAGLTKPEAKKIEIVTAFQDFDDFWQPFTLGAGPAPGYCASLGDTERERLRQKLQADLPVSADGSITLEASAWAIRSRKH